MVQLKTGQFEGITVHELEDKLVVEFSKYENKVAAIFKGKVQGGFYSSYLNDKSIEPQENNTLLAVSKDHLQSEEQIRDFNIRVNNAVNTHKQIQQDFHNIQQECKDILSFDTGKNIIPRYGQDPNRNWAYGEVLARNDNYVAFSSGETADAYFIRVLPVEKFLLSKEEERNAEQILNERLQKGEYKRLEWTKEDGKPSKIKAQDAVKKEATVKQEVAQEARKDAVAETANEKKEVATEQEASAQPAKKTTKKKQQALAA
ncbi:hypothetical protein K6L09_21220 [Burkholderia cepacia]